MNDTYRRATDEEKDCSEEYDMLIGPNGFSCFLGEPEDRTWYRDGRPVVAELNRLHALTDHPADDGWEFCIDWLQEVASGQIYQSDVDTLLSCQIGNSVAIDQHGGVSVGNVETKPVKTRGDVRRLCAALGIELKEPDADP